MVDRESVTLRLGRLDGLLAELERTRQGGLEAYAGDGDRRLITERRLLLAEQICIDVGAHLVSELGMSPPASYAGIFISLADAGHLTSDHAARLGQMARQRNLLVHAYLEIDDQLLFESLDHLGDLRSFAAAVQRIVDLDARPVAD